MMVLTSWLSLAALRMYLSFDHILASGTLIRSSLRALRRFSHVNTLEQPPLEPIVYTITLCVLISSSRAQNENEFSKRSKVRPAVLRGALLHRIPLRDELTVMACFVLNECFVWVALIFRRFTPTELNFS